MPLTFTGAICSLQNLVAPIVNGHSVPFYMIPAEQNKFMLRHGRLTRVYRMLIFNIEIATTDVISMHHKLEQFMVRRLLIHKCISLYYDTNILLLCTPLNVIT